jgi:hypothetical protein
MATPRSDLIPDPLPHGSFDNLPDLDALNELTARPHWVAWKAVPQPGKKPRKLPIAARTGMAASSTDPATWSDYRAAVERAKRSRLAGVGYVVSDDDDLTAIDLDDCIDEDSGDPLPWAQDILAHAETYAEISPSGLGIRMWVRGKIDKAVKRSGVELYARARYLTVTGWHIPGTPETINEAPHTLAALVERVEEQKPVPAPSKAMPSPSSPTTTDELSDLLSYISPDVGYHDWINVLMAIHAETGGAGFAMADQWSSRGSKYVNSKDVHQHWRSFRGQGVSMGTLAKMARDGGADLAEIAIRHKPHTPLDAEALAAVAAIIRHPDGTLTDADGVVIEPESTIAQPFVWQDPASLPQRQWIYAGHYIRKFVSLTLAPGGVGKSSLTMGEALSMATGQPTLHVKPEGRFKVWLWNGEDPMEELQRRMTAAMLHFGISPDDVSGRLFMNSGRQTEIIIAEENRKTGTVIHKPIIEAVKRAILANGIDVMIVDPFVSSHRVTENDNNAIDRVVKLWAKIADECNCAIELVHHVRKVQGGEVTVDDARGAGALLAGARSARVLNPMTEEEASAAGVKPARAYFRIDNGKSNLAPAPDKAFWHHLKGVMLPNGALGIIGDNVGVVTPWQWPDRTRGTTTDDLNRVKTAIAAALNCRLDKRSPEWVGHIVAGALEINLEEPAAWDQVSAMVATWIKRGHLKVVVRPGSNRQPKDFVEVGKPVEDASDD